MAAVASIVLADALATPVNHTFIPVGQDDKGTWWFEDQSRPSPIGYWRIAISQKRPMPGKVGDVANRVYKVTIALHEPILENVTNSTVSGVAPAPTLSYISRSETSFILPERSALQDRKDLRKMHALLLADTQVIALVEALQPIF